MSTHKHIDKICIAILLVTLLLATLFINSGALGVQAASPALGYEQRLFDNGRVHTIDIVMDDWEGFIATCQNEEYSACTVVIDGEAFKNVGIRAKGNTSLSNVAAMGSSRYSFKVEFDHYASGVTYHGLDKLSLNNTIQDATCMKDFLVYQLMGGFGVNAPLASYAFITVNGKDWGLYLAVEGVEDSFLQRTESRGELYKPDSMDFGGGRGNGRDFDMQNLWSAESGATLPGGQTPPENAGGSGGRQQGFGPGQAPPGDMGSWFDGAQGFGGGPAPTAPGGMGEAAQGGPQGGRKQGLPGGMGGMGGMGSADVKLQYIDDDPESYPNIFKNAKTDVTAADRARLIGALKALSGENAAQAVDAEQVLRYFVVHNFVCNGDSYTGSMVHNYYLYEESGRLAMIPWDYNLAFGAFDGGSATSAVNAPIDTPVSSGMGDRPMVDWVFESPEHTQLYHQYFEEFVCGVDFAGLIGATAELIAPYVAKDPTAFYTVEEFESGVAALSEFCRLRAESVLGQLGGLIPSTAAGQAEDASALVDASHLNLADMGSMGFGGGRSGRG